MNNFEKDLFKLLDKYVALQISHKDLTGTLELLLTDIEWQENSPTLKLVKRMIKKAKALQ